jgi:LPS-assembly lipoprotein
MWWARLGALLAGLSLAGCGFHPLYADSGPDPVTGRSFDADLAAIKVAPIAERIGQLLEISLRDDFNPTGVPVPAQWLLNVRLITSRAEVGLRKDGTSSRVQYTVTATYTLLDEKGITVFYGSARSFTAFDIVINEYAMVVAERDAQTRAARELGEDIRNQVALFMKRPKPQTSST